MTVLVSNVWLTVLALFGEEQGERRTTNLLKLQLVDFFSIVLAAIATELGMRDNYNDISTRQDIGIEIIFLILYCFDCHRIPRLTGTGLVRNLEFGTKGSRANNQTTSLFATTTSLS